MQGQGHIQGQGQGQGQCDSVTVCMHVDRDSGTCGQCDRDACGQGHV